MPTDETAQGNLGGSVFDIYMRGIKVDPHYSKDDAIAEFRKRYPEDTEEVVRGWLESRLEMHAEELKLSVFDWFCAVGHMVGGYGTDDAVQDFMNVHPEANEADVRAELERELIKAYGEDYRSVV